MREYETWMARAIAEARSSSADGDGPVGAILVRDGVSIGTGRNTKTSTRSGFAHAELNALLDARADLGRRPRGVTLYTTLEPCAMCLAAAMYAGVSRLVYGASDPGGGAVAMFAADSHHRALMPEIVSGVLREECEALKNLAGFGRRE